MNDLKWAMREILGIDEVQFSSGFSIVACLIQIHDSDGLTNFGHDIVQDPVL